MTRHLCAAAAAAVLLGGAGSAAADLYRWKDPETGSTKFSSYPPPWFGDPARERRAPKVEVIPARAAAAPAATETPEIPAPAAETPAAAAPEALPAAVLDARLRELLQRVSALATRAGSVEGSQALARQIQTIGQLQERLEKADPALAAARRADIDAAMRRLQPAAPR